MDENLGPASPALRRKMRSIRTLTSVICGCLAALLVAGAIYASTVTFRLKGQGRDRTNIMIYGLTADGKRTDTMILASYYWKERKLALLNIPRDLYASYDGHTTKIVALYAIAKAERPQDAKYPARYVSDFIQKEYGIPVDYWIVANMDAFKELVDASGGVTIDVRRPFTDYQYPTDDYSGYIRPAPHFYAGVQIMNGERALIFARSRHAEGPEGTDFARSKRQEMIIQALLEKLRQQGVLTDAAKAGAYLQIWKENFSSNFDMRGIPKIIQTTRVLDISTDVVMANWNNNIGFLCDATDSSGAYVLQYGVPGDCSAAAGTDSDSPYRRKAIEYVQNLLKDAAGKSIGA